MINCRRFNAGIKLILELQLLAFKKIKPISYIGLFMPFFYLD